MHAGNSIFFLLITAYVFAVFIGGIIVLDSKRRRTLQERIHRVGSRVSTTIGSVGGNIQRSSSHSWQFIFASCRRSAGFIGRHKLHAVLTAGLISMPVIFVAFLLPSQSLPGYEDLPPTSDPVVLALLRGEQLLPPPPMPPETFITPEVAAIRQDLGGASREWMSLDADFRQRLLTVFHLMAQKGYPMALLEGYRSPERQTYLASKGPHVTNAGAYQSYHQFGLAADCAFVRNGKLIISEKDPWAMQGYRLYGEIAESVGLVWGGRWKMMDLGHVELRKPDIIHRRQKN